MSQPPASPNAKRRILFVDDEAQFLQMVDRAMRLWSKNNLDIVSAQSASAALSILQNQPVNLVVLDVCMPVVDGLQFLSILNRRYPGVQKVVLTGYATEAYRSACLSNGAELFLEKPRTSEGMETVFATLDQLTRWQPEPGFRGVLRRVGLMDVIQMECLGRTSSVLVVSSPEMVGRIFIQEGSIVHAETADLKGMEALRRVLASVSGEFRLDAFSEPPEKTISGSWEGLLMDAAQARDESQATQPSETAPGLAEAAPEPSEPLAPPGRQEVRIDELMICSEAGDVLHAWQCANIDLRINFLEFLSQKARLLQNVLPLGVFDRAEFNGEGARLVAQIGGNRGVVLRSSPAKAEPIEYQEALARRLRSARRLTPELKSKAQQWFQQHLSMAGLLAATVQFSDLTGLTHSLSPQFAQDALENLRRCVRDGFQVLRLQKFSASRARWFYGQTAIAAAQWTDGTAVAFVLSRQSLDLNQALIDQRLQEFLEHEILTNR